MLHGLCTRVYFAIYAYMLGTYAYIKPCKYIYRLYIYIYIFYVYLFVFVHYICCIYANGCKLLQMHAPLHINYWVVHI